MWLSKQMEARRRRYWVHPINHLCESCGDIGHLYQELRSLCVCSGFALLHCFIPLLRLEYCRSEYQERSLSEDLLRSLGWNVHSSSFSHPSYYITTPPNVNYGANTSLAVHWFGEIYSVITVTAEILDYFHTSNILVNVNKVFQNDSIGILTIPADPRYNIVQQSLSMKPDLGVVSTEFSLSNNPLLGAWNIQATCDGTVRNVNFLVTENVSPKFDVTLYVPSFYIPPKELNLTGTVTAKYFYGRPVNGSVTVSVKPLYGEIFYEISKTYKISGSINFMFTHAEIPKFSFWQNLEITASVTEEFTGIVVNKSSSVPRVDSEYKLLRVGQPKAFIPGGNFTFKVQIQKIDNNNLTKEDRSKMVSVKIIQSAETYYYITDSTENVTLKNYTVPESAIIDVEFPVLQSTQLIQVQAYYQNTTEFFYFDKSYETQPSIQLQIAETILKVGTPFNVKVKTFPNVQDVYYVVTANRKIVSTGKNRTTFSLTPDSSWIPSAQIMVYYLNINSTFGDIVQNYSQVFSVKSTLGNEVTLSWSKNQAEPSENISLSISVKESRSLVGLQVVEKSSLLMVDRNDINARRIEDEVNSYSQSSLASLTNARVFNWYGYFEKQYEVLRPLQNNTPIFPDTWIWLNTNISSSLTTNLQVTVPNKNTTWVATAFVISEGLGLGVTNIPIELSVVKPLMSILHMPSSITRGEQCILEVIVFNSLRENLQVVVTLESSNSFDILVPNNSASTVPGQYNVTVQSEAGTTVLFPINPKKLGNATVKVTVTSKASLEVLSKAILVKAEGVKYFYSQSALFDLTGNGPQTVSKNFSFTFPSDVVQDTIEGFITVVGDLLVPSISGLESLIQMPYGCGEQNMINFAPNIYILMYLIATKQINSDIKEKTINYMEQGYQRELTYRRFDGSFSAFGDSDSSGSTWLTAFVFRCFLQARPFTYINSDVLNQAVDWLVQYQDLNTGIFSEPGRVIHTDLQGGLDGPITLTAYIVTSLLEDEVYRHRYESRVQKAVQYLEGKYDGGITSNYTLSVVVYALSLANSSKAGAALNVLNSRASITGSTKYWSTPSQQMNYYWQPRTTDVETAAYALLSYYQQGRITDGILVMKWLSQQRNFLGGFVSTQDTVMALQALSKFVSVVNFVEGAASLTLTVTGSGSFVPRTFQINSSSNLLELQRQQIEVSQPILLNATAVGKGLAIFQLNIAYNRKTTSRVKRNSPVPEAFMLDVTVTEDSSNFHQLSVNVCTSYKGTNNKTGMVILDIGLLSGFELSPIGIPTTDIVKLVEPKEDKVYVYLDSVSTEKICISVPMVRYAIVAGSQDAVVTIYEYYNPRNTATRTYNSLTMKKISYCEFCGFNCTQCRSNVPAPPQTSASTKPAFYLLVLSIILISYILYSTLYLCHRGKANMYPLWPSLLRLLGILSTILVTCDARPSYYITTPSYILPGENTSLAVHWFGDAFSEIIVSAGIMTTTRILVNVSKIFQNDVIGTISIPADPKNNIVQQWLQIKPVMGMVSKEFLLSDRLLLGDWKIQAASDGCEQFAEFSVAEHALLKFDVILNVPNYSDSKMLSLNGTVTAKYISGTPIKGKVTILVKPLYKVEGFNEVKKIDEILGSMNFSFTRAELKNVLNPKGMNVTVSVTEELTGIAVDAESYILNENSEYRLNLISQQPAFGPGLNFTAKIQVQRIDKKPFNKEERDEKVTFEITQRRSPLNNYTIVLQHALSESGIIDVEFPVLQSIQWVTIIVEYQNVSEIFNSDLIYTRNPFIDIQIPDSTLKVGREFDVQVSTYMEISEIYYVVVSKGFVVSAGRNTTKFGLIPEASWAPSAQITVYWINTSDNSGDIMQISKMLSIKGTLNNKVSLSWSKNIAHPSEHVLLSVNVREPHSLVGLRVIDKRSMLLGDGNDLTIKKVYEELVSYNQSANAVFNSSNKGPPASMTDAVIQNKYEYSPQTREHTLLPPRHTEIFLPEIWIWQHTSISSSITKNLDVAVPDRNASWVATAFVISEHLGLGIAEESVELTVFKSLSMSLDMPHSVTRGEEFIVEVILSSSLSKNLQVLVSLERHDSFEIVVPTSAYKGSVTSQHTITVPSQGEMRVLFPIRPKKLGKFPITVKATSNVASDVLTKTVLVKAEGVKYFYSQTALFELIGNENTSTIVSKNMSFTFPNDVVLGSEEIYVTVTGDLLGSSINGLESLIKMPHGCGEQNMISFAPNIYILQYLIATHQLKSDIRERAINVMEQGYQKELSYRRYDGSFSAFGNSDSSGSTWLSAFVFRCFLQARTFIYINPMVLNETVEWLVQYQDLNTGIFSEPGNVIHRELQGGQDGPITLTAYIVTSLLEDSYYRNLYATRVKKAVQYLERKFDEGIASNYTLSMVAYALSLANSSKAHEALTLLYSRANSGEGIKFWSSPSEMSNYYWQPRTTDIETAAYALLSCYQQGRIMDGIPVMKWLSQHRNHIGGYLSTQDTIIALQALSSFLLLAPPHDTSLTLAVTGLDSYVPITFHISNENLLVLQSQQIKVSQHLQVNATAIGRGLAILQINLIYNRKSSSRHRQNTVPEAFQLNVTVKEETNNINRLSVDVCMRFQGKGNESGMALLDVGYLSGFTLSPKGVIPIQSLKLVEPKEGKVYLYFDLVTKEGLCISIPIVRFAKVAHSQDAVVKVLDYYNPEMMATRTYNSLTMQQISPCDYCRVNCDQCIPNSMLSLGSKAAMSTFSFCMIVICYFVYFSLSL
ncbi:uncharacterized protein LOC130361023 [Hyla sarda]|uniref:uncharacterized protein LOC130361023 n=1 Tax=Hyla sarda TaxID=327740 RepID=UPI0024C2F1AA|nr:uncharacterized protein LOC130361023 [Hyla sarda]